MNRVISIKTVPGTKVHYTAKHGAKENGILKEVRDNGAFVVFIVGDDWKNYRNYTGALTSYDMLRYGWVDKEGNLEKEFCDHHYIHTNAKWQPENQRTCIYCGDTID